MLVCLLFVCGGGCGSIWFGCGCLVGVVGWWLVVGCFDVVFTSLLVGWFACGLLLAVVFC